MLSLHSRRAERETLEMLTEKGIENAIFHWYSGGIKTLNDIANSGFFFSVNSAMIQSANGKKIIAEIPRELILTETDYPYIDNSNIADVHTYLSILWNVSTENVEQIK
ncbi:MAG: TatD family hydrolase [Bacteroidales bacterium]|nr:TatD family hydrolase [Bacteroidales bacterium]MDD2832288.1 TatD family hydrolase [Bacteroidales bacterium]MDD3209521.1 TatD family hydrolase [Bacteroidales bacterium]MDD3698109.1 TatD family hydrolase [Bacteroidales bacterium]MDD4168474.1 TatD family hydrolase [Bacteroidales bacterium]